jgi:hypothetical protein
MVDVWEVCGRFELINYFLQVQKLESKLCWMVLLTVGRESHLQCLFTGLVKKVGLCSMFPDDKSGHMVDFSIKTQILVFGIRLFRLKMLPR